MSFYFQVNLNSTGNQLIVFILPGSLSPGWFKQCTSRRDDRRNGFRCITFTEKFGNYLKNVSWCYWLNCFFSCRYFFICNYLLRMWDQIFNVVTKRKLSLPDREWTKVTKNVAYHTCVTHGHCCWDIRFWSYAVGRTYDRCRTLNSILTLLNNNQSLEEEKIRITYEAIEKTSFIAFPNTVTDNINQCLHSSWLSCIRKNL